MSTRSAARFLPFPARAASTAALAAFGLVTASAPAATALPPLANGDTFAYATSEFGSYDGGPFALRRASQDLETVAFPVTYRGKSVYRLTDAVADTTDAYASRALTYFGFARDGNATALDVFASTYTASQADGTIAESRVYDAPYFTSFKFPENLAGRWSNDVGATMRTSSLQGGASLDTLRVANADGSSAESSVYAGPTHGTTTYVTSANGSGLATYYDAPAKVFGTPLASGSGFVIPITSSGTVTNVPDWYPGNGAPGALAATSEAMVALGRAPAACGSRAGTAAYEVSEKSYVLEPLAGLYTTAVTASYESPSLGLICTIENATQRLYDNLVNGTQIASYATRTISYLTSEQLAGPHARIAPIPRRLSVATAASATTALDVRARRHLGR